LDKIQERRNKKAAINTSQTRAEKAKAQAEYTEPNKQVKRSIRTDKRKYVNDLAMTAEKAAREGNMRQLYDTKKKLSGNYRKPERPVESKEGKVITKTEEQRNRCALHFKEPAQHRSSNHGPPSHQQLKRSAWQSDKSRATKQHLSRGTESRCNSNCKDTPHSLQEYLEGRTNTNRMKGRTSDQETSKCDNYRGNTTDH
uniref:Coiled-coil domain containing 177 n=1 Tax=Schistosoma curassoni TaxID=6186 RepID=A0A183L3Z2_9TREM